MYRQPQYIFSSRGRSRVYFNAPAICGTLTSFINRTVCSAPRVCFTSLVEEQKGVVKGALWDGRWGGVWTDVTLAPFPFEERWATLESMRLTGVQLILVSVKPKTSSVCSPEGSQDILVKDPLSLNCQATSNPSGESNYIGTISNPILHPLCFVVQAWMQNSG